MRRAISVSAFCPPGRSCSASLSPSSKALSNDSSTVTTQSFCKSTRFTCSSESNSSALMSSDSLVGFIGFSMVDEFVPTISSQFRHVLSSSKGRKKDSLLRGRNYSFLCPVASGSPIDENRQGGQKI